MIMMVMKEGKIREKKTGPRVRKLFDLMYKKTGGLQSWKSLFFMHRD